MPLFIYSHNPHSEGASTLKEAMKIRKIKHERSIFKGSPKKTVINWGSSEVPPEVLKCNVLNKPEIVRRSCNKLTFFQTIQGQPFCPPFTTNFDEAVEWIGKGSTIVARQILNGHSGNGIVIMTKDNPGNFVKAPLYTKYIKKQEEYRVHVVFGDIIDVQRKVLSTERAEQGNVNWYIRNLANGFIYQRSNINPNDQILQTAKDAVRISGLDFGAVDIIWNAREKQEYVLEINTAPGITGTTVTNYANAFRRFL